jgi:endonuclease YncB( thermonuclease family)
MSDHSSITPRAVIERIIGEEVDKRGPRPASREALVLIALGRIHSSAGAEEGAIPAYRVFDESGQQRTKLEGGEKVDLTIADVVAELQERHPTLFETSPAIPHAPTPTVERDWLIVAPDPNPIPADGSKWLSTTRLWLGKRRSAARSADTRPAVDTVIASPERAGEAVAEPNPIIKSLRWEPRSISVLIGAVALAASVAVFATREAARSPEHTAPATTRAPVESAVPSTSGKLATSNPSAPDPVRGVPEVIDTTTLKIGDEVLHLHGIEWARGGNADQLRSYLGNREVVCRAIPESPTHRCEVEGRDLSVVVLFNGGARATPQASADLLAAEQYARSGGKGVWKR